MTESAMFLRGDTVSLRPLELSDAPLVVRWLNDPETRRWLGRIWPFNVLVEEDWIRQKYQQTPPLDLTFAIILNADDRHVGNIGLHAIDWVNRRAQTGMLIGEKAFRGKGHGPAAKALLLAYAFDSMNLELVTSYTLETNPASSRSLEKSGYTHEATLRRRFFREGSWISERVYSITADEWRSRQER